jgi:hypothetical protein
MTSLSSLPSDAFLHAALIRRAPLRPETFAIARQRIVLRSLFTGERLVVRDGSAGYGAIVASGALRESYGSEREYARRIVLSGELTTTCFDPSPEELAVIALRPSYVWILDARDSDDLCATTIDWETFRTQLLAACYREASEREARLATMTPLEHYEYLRAAVPRLEREVPLYAIASLLRISPEHLSRLRAVLARRKRPPLSQRAH